MTAIPCNVWNLVSEALFDQPMLVVMRREPGLDIQDVIGKMFLFGEAQDVYQCIERRESEVRTDVLKCCRKRYEGKNLFVLAYFHLSSDINRKSAFALVGLIY